MPATADAGSVLPAELRATDMGLIRGGSSCDGEAPAPPATWSVSDCQTCHDAAAGPAFAQTRHGQQDQPFYPYTINSAILTPSGARADSVSSLQQPSLGGKIDTTIHATFSSRPTKDLSVRAQFRSYDLGNETDRFIITGDVAASPDRAWSVVTPNADDPYGHATANVYDNTTTRFSASASYDIGDLTLEAAGRFARLERTSREAEKGDDDGFGFAALYHATTNQWATTTGVALNNLLNYAGTDETDTFGLNANFQLKPDAHRSGDGRGPGHHRLGRHHADDVLGAARLLRGEGLEGVGGLAMREDARAPPGARPGPG